MCAQPPTAGMQSGSSVGNTYTFHGTFLSRSGADSHAQSVLVNGISASELRRTFIKVALSVG